MLEDVIRNLPQAQGYSDARGLLSARRAVVQYHEGWASRGSASTTCTWETASRS